MLVTEYHLTVDEVYALTPRQVHDVYFHPREKTGALKMPPNKVPAPADPVAALEVVRELIRAGIAQAAPEVQAALAERLEAARGDTR